MLVLGFVGRIDGFHTHIEAKNEIAKVKAQANTVSHSYLLIEIGEMELSTWLLCIRTQSPDVSCINEGCTIKLPEEISAIFGTKVEFHIARLIDEVDATISTTKSSWSEFSHSPSSHRVGSTREISLLKRQHRAIAIRISNAESSMQGKSVVSIKAEQTCAIEVELSILCVCYIKKCMLPITIGMELSYTSESIK